MLDRERPSPDLGFDTGVASISARWPWQQRNVFVIEHSVGDTKHVDN